VNDTFIIPDRKKARRDDMETNGEEHDYPSRIRGTIDGDGK